MKLEPEAGLDEWLAGIEGEPDEFDWDAGNRGKGQKHGVEPSEVESLFHRALVLAGRIVEPAHGESRWLLLGETDTGRRLALIFTRRDDKLRPITCRAMRRSERRFYDEAKANAESD